MLKSKIDIHASILTKIVNLYLRNSCFLDDLKDAEVSPIFKKNDELEKENYQCFTSHLKGLWKDRVYSN